MDLRVPRRAFLDVLDNGRAVWDQSQDADRARLKTIAEDTFLRFIVGWESFASEWFIGCVNRDASRLRRYIERELETWLRRTIMDAPHQRYTVRFPSPVVSLPTHPRLDTVRELLDPGGRNIEFASFDELRDRSHRHLQPRFAGRVQSLYGAGANEIVDAGLAIRNTLAHRSRQSVQLMNQRVRTFSSYPRLRKQTMSTDGIGTYLVARTTGGEARLLEFRREFARIAQIMVP